MKWLIEETENLVKAKQITKNEEEYGDSLVELTDEELDHKLKDYSAQGKYVAMYYQVQTQRHGIEFNRFYYGARVVKDKLVLPEYNWLPKEIADNEIHSGEKCYCIKTTLVDTEIVDTEYRTIPYSKEYLHYLTMEELADKVSEYLKQGKQVRFGKYELRKKKWAFITDKVVKEVKDNEEIMFI